jgi:hypothetical protein
MKPTKSFVEFSVYIERFKENLMVSVGATKQLVDPKIALNFELFDNYVVDIYYLHLDNMDLYPEEWDMIEEMAVDRVLGR